LQKGRPFDFHTSNIQRAQTERLAQRIVRLENPILRPPEGRSLRDVSSVNGTQKQNAFSGASALFHVSSALFFHIFSRKREKIWPAERRMRLRKPHRASGAFEARRRRHSAPFRRTRNNPIAGAQNGASASVQDTNPVQMIPEQKQGNAYERTA